MGKMIAEFAVWTPEMAKKTLEVNNTRNRTMSPKIVQTYAELMRSGDWDENNLDPITINEEGVLENGQHRLAAVVRCGKAIKFFTVFGSAPTFGSFDRGKGRTVVDVININGFCDKIGSQHVAVAYLILSQYGMKYRNDYLVQEYIVANERDIRMAINISACSGRSKYLIKKASAQTAIYLALKEGYKEETLRKFSEIVNTGFYETEDQTSAIVLRNMILADPRFGINQKEQKVWGEGIVAAALLDFVKGKKRKQPYTVPNIMLFNHVKELDKGFIEAHGMKM